MVYKGLFCQRLAWTGLIISHTTVEFVCTGVYFKTLSQWFQT